MKKNLYYGFLRKKSEEIKDYQEVFSALKIRPYLIDRALGGVRGIEDGKYKDTPQAVVETIVDILLVNDLIRIDNVESIPLTNYRKFKESDDGPDYSFIDPTER